MREKPYLKPEYPSLVSVTAEGFQSTESNRPSRINVDIFLKLFFTILSASSNVLWGFATVVFLNMSLPFCKGFGSGLYTVEENQSNFSFFRFSKLVEISITGSLSGSN